MKKNWIILGLILLIPGSWYFAGCGIKAEKFGEVPGEDASKTAIGTILLNPQDYVNKDVVIEGTISSECPTGGWINVQSDSGGSIYIEMHGSEFAPIPQRVGRKVIVAGSVYQTEGEPKETKILGKGVIIK